MWTDGYGAAECREADRSTRTTTVLRLTRRVLLLTHQHSHHRKKGSGGSAYRVVLLLVGDVQLQPHAGQQAGPVGAAHIVLVHGGVLGRWGWRRVGRRRRRRCRERPVLLTARLWTDKWEERQSPSSSEPVGATARPQTLSWPHPQNVISQSAPGWHVPSPLWKYRTGGHRCPTGPSPLLPPHHGSDWMLFQLSLWATLPSQTYPSARQTFLRTVK